MSHGSMTGFWIGVYHYPQDQQDPTNFNAVLEQVGDQITGEICENVTFGFESKTLIFASLSGHIIGSRLSFLKSYEGINTGWYGEVSYEGDVTDKKNYVSGVWNIPGDWSGTFAMQRSRGSLEDLAIGRAEHKTLEILKV